MIIIFFNWCFWLILKLLGLCVGVIFIVFELNLILMYLLVKIGNFFFIIGNIIVLLIIFLYFLLFGFIIIVVLFNIVLGCVVVIFIYLFLLV